MNDAQEQAWTQAEQLGAMNTENMDFSNLLDLGDIDLTTFPALDQDSANHAVTFAQHSQDAQYGANMQGIQDGHATHDFASQDYNNHGSATDLHGFGASVSQSMWDSQTTAHQPMQDMQSMVYHQPHPIPPTPNSYELHGGDPALYLQQLDPQSRAYLDLQFQHNKHRDDFTPLVSPAVTPQDSRFNPAPDYAIPGTYFSPLTSPALHAQNAAGQYRQSSGLYKRPGTANTSLDGSPTSALFDINMMGEGVSPPEPARRSKRKTQAPRSTGPAARTTRSPIVKGSKRKSDSMASARAGRDIDQLLQDAQVHRASSNQKQQTSSTESSGLDSTSPEALSEALMGPPPRPGSALQSPSILAQTHSAPSLIRQASAAPATPGSLMSIDRSQRTNGMQYPHSAQPLGMTINDMTDLDDFALPPSAAVARPRSASGANHTSSVGAAPRAALRKTPKLGPLSTPSSSLNRTTSATASPAISAMASPVSATTPSFAKLQENGGKIGKQRSSVSGGSSMVSPALRPKISPSIKPLLPEGAKLNDTQQALLLASKSNYTHLLEGTLLPGVSYPDSLSSGLSSKRTSHKIAEQGRRNRINEALKEMQTLLPSPTIDPKLTSADSTSSSDGVVTDGATKDAANGTSTKDSPKASAGMNSAASDAKAANSKAATVENAIDYIRALQRERLLMELAMKSKDDELNALRRRLKNVDVAHDERSERADSTMGSARGATTEEEEQTTEQARRDAIAVS